MFDKQLYKQRNVVERCFNRLKQCRSVATRYDRNVVQGHRHHRRTTPMIVNL
ncbi:transposase [Micromonospora sp. HB375]|nr:transposase [Micromonospora sp. HB375]MDH6466493.1 transposase [Micromonospora sp. H404/HB375]